MPGSCWKDAFIREKAFPSISQRISFEIVWHSPGGSQTVRPMRRISAKSVSSQPKGVGIYFRVRHKSRLWHGFTGRNRPSLTTEENADHIIVLENGRVAGKGTHRSLLAPDGLYAGHRRTQFAIIFPAKDTTYI